MLRDIREIVNGSVSPVRSVVSQSSVLVVSLQEKHTDARARSGIFLTTEDRRLTTAFKELHA